MTFYHIAGIQTEIIKSFMNAAASLESIFVEALIDRDENLYNALYGK